MRCERSKSPRRRSTCSAKSRRPPDHPIILAAQELDNLVVTPHTAWSAREARERLLHEVKENIAAFLENKPRNLVA